MFKENLARLRKQSQLSQEFMAGHLGVTRATYIKIENGQKSPTLNEVEKLAEVLGIEIEELISRRRLVADNSADKMVLAQAKPVLAGPRPKIKLDALKLQSVLLYVLTRVGAQPNMGETALYKLLYFIDFDYYEKFGQSITGMQYRHNHYGPTPGPAFRAMTKALVDRGELKIVETKFYDRPQKRYITGVEANLHALSGQEVCHIDEVLGRLGGKTAKELTDLAHQDMPWLATEPGEVINYQLAKYRTTPTAVTSDEDEL